MTHLGSAQTVILSQFMQLGSQHLPVHLELEEIIPETSDIFSRSC